MPFTQVRVDAIAFYRNSFAFGIAKIPDPSWGSAFISCHPQLPSCQISPGSCCHGSPVVVALAGMLRAALTLYSIENGPLLGAAGRPWKLQTARSNTANLENRVIWKVLNPSDAGVAAWEAAHLS